MEIYKKNWSIAISSNKKEIEFANRKIIVDEMIIDMPWEYEKSWILAQALKFNDKLLFQLKIENKNVAYIEYDDLDITEDISSFLWNIDILIILWSKNSIKIFENLEARSVLPFWEQKDIFFNTLWQHPEPTKNFKLKEFQSETEVIFINLE